MLFYSVTKMIFERMRIISGAMEDKDRKVILEVNCNRGSDAKYDLFYRLMW